MPSVFKRHAGHRLGWSGVLGGSFPDGFTGYQVLSSESMDARNISFESAGTGRNRGFGNLSLTRGSARAVPKPCPSEHRNTIVISVRSQGPDRSFKSFESVLYDPDVSSLAKR